MDHGNLRKPGRRARAAGALALAGAAALGFAFLQPSGKADIPGWEPVNDRVAEALDGLASPGASKPAASGEAPAAASAGASAPASGPAPDAQTSASAPDAQTSAPAPAASAAAAAAAPSAASAASASAAATPPAVSGLLNLNEATAEQLDALKGIGPSKAQAIVDYRTKNGPFRSVDDLLNVKGIGPKLLEGIRAEVTV